MKMKFILTSLFAFSTLAVLAQSGQKWSSNGNVASSTDVLGTTNAQSLILIANGLEALKIKPNGSAIFKKDVSLKGGLHIDDFAGSNFRLLQTDANGNILPFTISTSAYYLSGDMQWTKFPAPAVSLWEYDINGYLTPTNTNASVSILSGLNLNFLAGNGIRLLQVGNSGKVSAFQMGTANQYMNGLGQWANLLWDYDSNGDLTPVNSNANISTGFLSTGGLLLSNLAGSGTGLLQKDNNGKVSAFPMGAANQVLNGLGQWTTVSGVLWQNNGNDVYWNNGNVGIGTNAPAYKLDVDGDVFIHNNLYVGGAILITDKVKATSEVKTAKMSADTLMMDSTKMIGKTDMETATVKDSIIVGEKMAAGSSAAAIAANDAKVKLSVNGATEVNGILSAKQIEVGDVNIVGNLRLGNTIALSHGQIGNTSVFGLGANIVYPPPGGGGCAIPDNGYMAQVLEKIQITNGVGRPLELFVDGTASYIESHFIGDPASSSSGHNPLNINKYCHEDLLVFGKTAIGANATTTSEMLNVAGGINSDSYLLNGNPLGVWEVNGTSLYHSSGKVGIGTSSPLDKLDIADANYHLLFSSKLAAGSYSYLTKVNDMGIFFSDLGGSAGQNASSGFVIAPLKNANAGLRMDGNGNVGIGTNTPSEKLDVMGTINIDASNSPAFTTTGWRPAIISKLSDIWIYSDADQSTGKYLGFGMTNGGFYMIKSTAKVNGTHSYPFSYKFDNDANQQQLKVRGSIVTNEVLVVTGDNGDPTWADYVFAKDYKLKSISELEEYYLKNHHLPNIPSAKEIEDKGLKLGNMSIAS